MAAPESQTASRTAEEVPQPDAVPARDQNTGRRGGRSARRELRAAPKPRAERPVQPGMEGGRYAPLTPAEIEKINGAALDVLEQIGLGDPIPSCIEYMTAAGCSLSPEGRMIVPRGLVEDTLAKAWRRQPLCARDPARDLEPWDKKVHFGTAGAAVHVADAVTGEYRESNLIDLYDMARLVDQLTNIHFFQRPLTARDMVDPLDMDINSAYACAAGTTKHIGVSFTTRENTVQALEMLYMFAGGEEAFRARPFASMSNCFVVPPLKFAEDASGCLEEGVKGGMPILLLAAGQAGATSPAALAGAVVQQVAEVLGGLVYVNAIVPGAPAIFGTWPFVSDLRTGAMSGGSPEQALLMAACGQMAHFYDLPGGVTAAMTDSKIPDAQAGYEKGYTTALVGNSGANLIYEAAGMHASLLGTCFESFVIDNDILGAALRTVRGIEVTDDSLSIQAMREVCIGGPGHYLGHGQTMDLMETEYVYPDVGDRTSPKEWAEQGNTDIVTRARKRTQDLLATHYPAHIPPEIDAAIRARFDIRIPPADMQPGNGRW